MMAATGGIQSVHVVIHLTRQALSLWNDGQLALQFPISTSRFGPGEQAGSLCTPRGRHVIRAMIGRGVPPGTVFRSRRPTGEIISPQLIDAEPGRDWILGRILWLSGCEPGRNRLGSVDTMRRYIYIHGTTDQEPMGVPFSHGCIRMRIPDVCRLFDEARPGTTVDIVS